MSSQSHNRLGRGLGALIAARAAVEAPPTPTETGLRQLPIGQIRPNPYQPRREFKPEDLADLEASLRSSGLLQPISVRPAPTGTGYELIAGERRLRAAVRLGWTEIPAVVRDIDDRALLSLALVENLQRTDLNPIEEADGYQRLIDEFSLTQQEVADLVGKDRSTVANILRLLSLPPSVRRLVWEGALSVGHARALLSLQSPDAMADMARQVVAEGLSVREVERRARERAGPTARRGRAKSAVQMARGDAAELRRIDDELKRHFQTDARVVMTGSAKGEVRVSFYSADDLERVLDLMLGPQRKRS